jgi:aldose 1-epimerase
MLKIRTINNDNKLLNFIQVYDNNFSIKILPNLGASIQELTINNVEIIDGISLDNEGLQRYSAGYNSANLFPFANRIEDGRYTFQEKIYQLGINEKKLNNAIHGLVYDKCFIIKKCKISNNEAQLILSFESKGNLEGFPFKFIFEVEYVISASGKIRIVFSVQNTDKKAFPFAIGWHPYFKSAQLSNSELNFEAKEQYLCSDKDIPYHVKKPKFTHPFSLKDQILDDCFSLLKPSASFIDKNYKLDLEFAIKDGAYLQIFTPHLRKSIALEPMTAATNSFNNNFGLKTLSPFQSFSWPISVHIKTSKSQ